MKSHTEAYIKNLDSHIPSFSIDKIDDWLKQFSKGFSATLEPGSCGGLIMKIPDSNIGPEFMGDDYMEKKINMFHHYINWHYCKIVDGKCIVNNKFKETYDLPIFG